ncbi:hypothetical protein [Cohnella abietis]|uniref:Uncharacterized protein n=1 Tax=Cohnella abietis TaxID=2507935 RepID=A0A3T1DBE0_9BACL|nr:hypothetical protein [Cohnella abietis]BBI35298.1 hypothetical protein KCTCHS21_46970 [Cohnella abietis]
MKPKHLMLISGPSMKVKEALSQAGFVRDFVHRSTYRTELDSSLGGAYIFLIPCHESDGVMTLYGESAFFDGISDSDVPEDIQAAALDRWHALRVRISNAAPPVYSPERGDRRPSAPIASRPIELARNGSMVQDFADLQRLGHDMDRMKNEQQLNEEGLVNDPIQ